MSNILPFLFHLSPHCPHPPNKQAHVCVYVSVSVCARFKIFYYHFF